MPTATKRQRWTHDARRRQILEVARRLFTERHYAAVSTEDIAREAGVARGLLNHYFGTKRDLFVAVVRDQLERAAPAPAANAERPRKELIDDQVRRWLDFVGASGAAGVAALAPEGFGRDAELEALAADARDRTVARIVRVLGLDPHDAALRVVLRTYSGLAEQAVREWLITRSIDREQVHRLLASALSAMVDQVAPAVGVQLTPPEGAQRAAIGPASRRCAAGAP